MAKGRPVGFKESEETKARKRAAMLEIRDRKSRANLHVSWPKKEGWQPFGHRLDFLSPEQAHLSSGKLSVLPPKGNRGEE